MLSNPFHEKNIEIKNIEIMVHNHAGKMLMNTQSDQALIELDLSEIKAGLYFISVKSESRKITEKIIIQ